MTKYLITTKDKSLRRFKDRIKWIFPEQLSIFPYNLDVKLPESLYHSVGAAEILPLSKSSKHPLRPADIRCMCRKRNPGSPERKLRVYNQNQYLPCFVPNAVCFLSGFHLAILILKYENNGNMDMSTLLPYIYKQVVRNNKKRRGNKRGGGKIFFWILPHQDFLVWAFTSVNTWETGKRNGHHAHRTYWLNKRDKDFVKTFGEVWMSGRQWTGAGRCGHDKEVNRSMLML